MATRRLAFRIPGNLSVSDSEVFIAAKVEIGRTQTLAHQENGEWVLNEVPNFAAELTKANPLMKEGGTISGNLIFSGRNAGVYEDTTAYEVGTSPSSDFYTIGLRNRDKNQITFGLFNSFLKSDGNVGVRMRTEKNGVQNELQLMVDRDGNRIVALTDHKPWLNTLRAMSNVSTYYNNAAGDVIDTMLDGCALVATTSSVNASLYNAIIDSFCYVFQFFYRSYSATEARIQIAYPFSKTNPRWAWRIYNQGWGIWHVEDNIYAVNNVFTTAASIITLPGTVNGNSTTIWVSVPVDKSMAAISTITVTSMNGWFSGPTGALNGSASAVQYVGASGYSIACVKLTDRVVRIALTKSSAFTNSVNNGSVVFFGTLTLKFT